MPGCDAPCSDVPFTGHSLLVNVVAIVLGGIAAEGWEPDVALINYYREGDTLGGHKDDVEQDQTAPIVALSLGCDAIFLLGGESIALAIGYFFCSQEDD